MFNLLPAIMLLFVQGMGDVDPTFRNQQALLDLAQRVGAVQNIEDLEDLLSETPGLNPQQIASWMDAFYALHPRVQSADVVIVLQKTEQLRPDSSQVPLPDDCFLSSSRSRDGPAF